MTSESCYANKLKYLPNAVRKTKLFGTHRGQISNRAASCSAPPALVGRDVGRARPAAGARADNGRPLNLRNKNLSGRSFEGFVDEMCGVAAVNCEPNFSSETRVECEGGHSSFAFSHPRSPAPRRARPYKAGGAGAGHAPSALEDRLFYQCQAIPREFLKRQKRLACSGGVRFSEGETNLKNKSRSGRPPVKCEKCDVLYRDSRTRGPRRERRVELKLKLRAGPESGSALTVIDIKDEGTICAHARDAECNRMERSAARLHHFSKLAGADEAISDEFLGHQGSSRDRLVPSKVGFSDGIVSGPKKLSRALLGLGLLFVMKHHARRLFIIGWQNSSALVTISVTNFVMVAYSPLEITKTSMLCAICSKKTGM
ncbi:hypothetical protein EVAR_48257_1 [Eumeta japonica]|uniref:Uncharacterized protein n=1 Tax=Eumeta variegata TaxID=151549 RepID=A0A4C1YIH3_EUMVA|nr:hypothetical protein EVAR_48257_1 [Eumeta japonica]